MRNPVNDPGPAATANRSTSATRTRCASNRRTRSPGNRAPCATPARPRRPQGHRRRARAPRFPGGLSCRERAPACKIQFYMSTSPTLRRLRVPERESRQARTERHAGHAPVSRREAAISRCDPVFSHGGLLRDVLRGRARRGARARSDAHVAFERRSGHVDSDVRRAISRARYVFVSAGQERVPRRHLRSGRRPEKSQGSRQARDRPRRVAGNADRLAASRRTVARVSAGADPIRPQRRWGRSARFDDRRIFLRGIRRGRGPAGAGGRSDGAAAARDRRGHRSRFEPRARRRRRRSAAGDTRRAVDVRARIGAAHAHRPVPHQRARRLRARRTRGRRVCRGRPAPLSARHAESRPRARPQHRLQDICRLPAHRRGHPQTSRNRRIDGWRPRGHPAPRDRSDGHRHGGAAAARVAAAPARLARSHPRPPGCRRGVRLSQYRPRQVPRGLEDTSRISSASSRVPRSAMRGRAISSA